MIFDERKAAKRGIVMSQNKQDQDKSQDNLDERIDDEVVQEEDDILEDDEELSPLELLEKERDELKDQYYRTAAEMENVKRRAARDVEQANKYGPLSFIRDLTTPLDNMQRALDTAPEDKDGLDETYRNILIGLEMTVQEITKIMEKHGVNVVNPEGEKFDYNHHQAMFEVPTDDAEPGTVVAVAQQGYVLHDRLIRPAMVGVAKAAKDDS